MLEVKQMRQQTSLAEQSSPPGEKGQKRKVYTQWKQCQVTRWAGVGTAAPLWGQWLQGEMPWHDVADPLWQSSWLPQQTVPQWESKDRFEGPASAFSPWQ